MAGAEIGQLIEVTEPGLQALAFFLIFEFIYNAILN